MTQCKPVFSLSNTFQWVLILPCALLILAMAGAALADDALDMPRVPLDKFSFDGMNLPTNIAQLKRQYPAAEIDSQGLDEKIGLTCYLVKNLPAADSARFCFYDGALYQAEFSYQPARIAAQGGMPAVRRKLVASFGPPDHVDAVRMTWRLNASHRADFYTAQDGRALVITDTSRTGLVDQRRKNETLTGAVDLGF